MSLISYFSTGQNMWYGLFILSLVLSFELLSATTSELCIQPPSTSDTSSSCTCQSCGFATSQAHKLCVKGDIICIPSNYSKFELPNVNSATEVQKYPNFLSPSRYDFFLYQ